MSSYCDKLVFILVGVHTVKTSSDTQPTDQLSQSTGCLSYHRPIVTEENLKLYPSHCVCFAQHEVILVSSRGSAERLEK